MKYYETHYEEYILSSNKFNIHPEWNRIHDSLPSKISDMGNIVVYGPSGVGKYTQALKIIQKYSPSGLKYDKKINVQTDKQNYSCRISDTHYEVDMSLLGCNSKILWHEVFSQVVDIVSVKPNKMGFIVCKNFHHIHNELLEIFYSYMQQYNHPDCGIQLRFIILTEHLSFIPNNMLNCCQVLSVKRPSKQLYIELALYNKAEMGDANVGFLQRIHYMHPRKPLYGLSGPLDSGTLSSPLTQGLPNALSQGLPNALTQGLPNPFPAPLNNELAQIVNRIDADCITNMKEFRSFSLLSGHGDIPEDIFNIVCNNIITEMENHQKIVFTQFRDTIYDMLIYNLDVSECIWHIITHFIENGGLVGKGISNVLVKTHLFFKYFNNNYRPIYHLESILFYIIMQIYGLPVHECF